MLMWRLLFFLVVCEGDQFGCVSENRCLPQEYVCDGIPDCQVFGFFDRDESNCSTGIILLYIILCSCVCTYI